MHAEATSYDPMKSIRSALLTTGGLLTLLGAAGIFLPSLLSLAIEVFLGGLMIAGGSLWAYYTYRVRGASLVGWLKPLILVVGGLLLIVYPVSGIAALVLLMSFYLITDAFGSFGLAMERRPLPGWFWMILNGGISLTLAALILVGWPATSMFYLGIFIGISIFFDGVSLLMLGAAMGKG